MGVACVRGYVVDVAILTIIEIMITLSKFFPNNIIPFYDAVVSRNVLKFLYLCFDLTTMHFR